MVVVPPMVVVAPGLRIVPIVSPVHDYRRRGHDHRGSMHNHWRRGDHNREWQPDTHRYMDSTRVCRARQGQGSDTQAGNYTKRSQDGA